MKGCLFDTNIFNRILDGDIDTASIAGKIKQYATHVELGELRSTSNPERRKELLGVFEAIGPEQIPTSSAAWGVSSWDKAQWTKPGNFYEPILAALNARNKRKPNNVHDALIADTAIQNGLVLVTEDGDLAVVARAHGAEVMDLATFMRTV